MKVLSTNVAVRRADPSGRHAYTGIDKYPRPVITAIRHLEPVTDARDHTDEGTITQPEVAGDPWVATARQKSDDEPPF